METPRHDKSGNRLLTDEEYHRIHMMEEPEYNALPPKLKKQYVHTSAWHFAQRSGGGDGDLSTDSFVTASGKTPDELIAYHESMQSQRGK